MCKEVFQIVEKMNLEELETQMALQCAPLIAGMKISNLLIVQNSNAEDVKKLLQGTPITSAVLYQTNRKTTFLLYRKEEVINYLHQETVKEAMIQFGYKNVELPSILKELSLRYRAYMSHREEFPHELGLLLGYPLEDVMGFIENQGQNFLYSGYWKVYGNVEETRALFSRFEYAKEQMIRMVSKGMDMSQILQIFGKNYQEQLAV
ncbi:MAG: DUF3793 family protein [Roseburia sp.]